jgi:hypothetical protein
MGPLKAFRKVPSPSKLDGLYCYPRLLLDDWHARTLRRLTWLLGALVVLFLATELAGVLRWIPDLLPVSFHALITNPLFAIGFGGPLLLHLSSLPRPRELVVTLTLGCLLAWLSILLAHERTAMQWVIGLGLASTIVLSVRAVRGRGDGRTEALLFLVPALVTLFFTLEAAMFLGVISHYQPYTFDSYAYAGDRAFGPAVSFKVGQWFALYPWLAAICTAIYLAPPPGLIFVYAMQVRSRRPPPIDIVTLLVALGALGYALYFAFPVCGPKFAFGPAFPFHPPDAALLSRDVLLVPPAPRNAMPSLHFASALIAFLYARRHGRIATAVAALFLLGTILATMGTGEHYLVDLIVAIPVTLFVDALFTPPRRYGILIPAFLLAFFWEGLLHHHTPQMLARPLIPWLFLAATLTLLAIPRSAGASKTIA